MPSSRPTHIFIITGSLVRELPEGLRIVNEEFGIVICKIFLKKHYFSKTEKYIKINMIILLCKRKNTNKIGG